MASDRPDDDLEPDAARPEQHPRPDEQHRRPDGPVAGRTAEARSEWVEPRTRAEYYEALRAADGQPAGGRSADDLEVPGTRADHSGWDTIDASNHPAVDAIHVSPERTIHILEGDSTGGGHRHGVGKPGKTEFPASWDDEKVIANVLDVARKPDKAPTRQDWNDTWLCTGTRDRVDVWAVVELSGDILTGCPEEGGPGVVRNPRRGRS